MKKRILVFQFRTDVSLKHEQYCFKKAIGEVAKLDFVNVFAPKPALPKIGDLKKYSAFILGGSGEFYLSRLPKSEQGKLNKLKPLVKHFIKNDIPCLGICFGHQIICQVMGSKVKAIKEQSETGSYKVHFKARVKNKLLNGHTQPFYAIQAHKDSVATKPRGGKLIVSTTRNKYHGFLFGENVYTLQFHPELDQAEVKYRLLLYPEYVKSTNLTQAMKKFKDSKQANKLLGTFVGTLS